MATHIINQMGLIWMIWDPFTVIVLMAYYFNMTCIWIKCISIYLSLCSYELQCKISEYENYIGCKVKGHGNYWNK